MPTSSPLNRAATSSALSELEPEGRNSASDVSPCSLRHVPPRTARVAGRQLRVVSRSKPVFFFIPSYPSACSFNAATTASPSAAVRMSPPRSAPRHPSASRSEEHTSELQSLMRISYAVFCLKKKPHKHIQHN